jgi:branched-chain amino acid transport system substrate-binding protein
MAAAQTYDAMHLMLRALFQTRGDTRAERLKQALEQLDKPYVGVITTYDQPFSPSDHDAFSINMIWLGVWRNGEIRYHYAEDEKRAGFIRRKQ